MRMIFTLLIVSALTSSSMGSAPIGAITLTPTGSLVPKQPIGISYHVAGLSGVAGNKVGLTCVVQGPDGSKSSMVKTKPLTQGHNGLEADMNIIYGDGTDFASTEALGNYSATCTIAGSGWARATAAFKVSEY